MDTDIFWQASTNREILHAAAGTLLGIGLTTIIDIYRTPPQPDNQPTTPPPYNWAEERAATHAAHYQTASARPPLKNIAAHPSNPRKKNT